MGFSGKGKRKWDFSKPKKEFREELLSIDRVTRVNSWWRQLRFRAVMVIWDWKWRVWFWTWKSWEVVDAISKAIASAKKNMIKVSIVNWTVAYNVEAKFKAAKIMIHPASEGTWIIAGWAARKVLTVAWYKDVLAKKYGSTSLINNAKATLKALTSLKEEKKVKSPHPNPLPKGEGVEQKEENKEGEEQKNNKVEEKKIEKVSEKKEVKNKEKTINKKENLEKKVEKKSRTKSWS